MNEMEYKEIQKRLSRKIIGTPGTNKTEAYDEGILAAKSIISAFYKEVSKHSKS